MAHGEIALRMRLVIRKAIVPVLANFNLEMKDFIHFDEPFESWMFRVKEKMGDEWTDITEKECLESKMDILHKTV